MTTQARRSRVPVAGAAVYLASLGALSLVATALSQGTALAEGRFVGEVDHAVVRMRVFDRFTLYVDGSTGEVGADLLTSFMLMVLTGFALLALALSARLAPAEGRLHLLFTTVAVSATFLAFDEQYELIDSLGYNVPAFYVPDLILYTPFVIAFFVAFRPLILASRPAVAVLGAGGLMYVAAQAIDRLPNDRLEGVEEKLEVLASGVLATGFGILAVAHVALLSLRGPADGVRGGGEAQGEQRARAFIRLHRDRTSVS